jgi:hypothetical protein
MLILDIDKQELFNEKTNEFINVPEMHLKLEHSLISLKKWESKWHKPFLTKISADKRDKKDELTMEELYDYICCMSITELPLERCKLIPYSYVLEIVEYIKDPMTATWFSKTESVTKGAAKSSSEIITNEIIYYWMIELGIPQEYQKWHLNQLLTLIKVVNLKREPKKKMSRTEEARQRAALNAARRAKHHSKG